MKKFLAFALIAVVLVGVFCFSACDEKEEEKFVFTEDMNSEEVFYGILSHVQSGTISMPEEYKEAFLSFDEALGGILSTTALSFDVKNSDISIDVTFADIVNVMSGGVKYVTNGFTSQGFTAFYEKCDDFDDTRKIRVYQFLEQDDEILYSVQEMKLGQLKNIHVLEDTYSSSLLQFMLMLTQIDFESVLDVTGGGITLMDFYFADGKIIISVSGNLIGDKSTITPMFELTNINSSELDIPEQYKDYKSLGLTR